MTEDEEYRMLHRRREAFGSSDGGPHLPFLLAAAAAIQAKDLVDFGCGKSAAVRRVAQLGFPVAGHDPNVPDFAEVPERRFDLLYSFDVLEHIPRPAMDEAPTVCAALSDTALLIPHLGLASTTLPNGENAHCTILKPDEWVGVVARHYRFVTAVPHVSDMHTILVASQQPQERVAEACAAMREGFAGLPDGLKARLRMARRLLLSDEMRAIAARAIRRRLPSRTGVAD